jgi:hypothetical protein
MFINTSNRLTKFYTSNKHTINTLLLILQLIAMAIAQTNNQPKGESNVTK